MSNLRRKITLLLAAVSLIAGGTIATVALEVAAPEAADVITDVGTAEAATFMFTTSYWYSGDAKMMCNSVPVYKSTGRYCGSGYVSIKYPGSSSYCYRRNAGTIWQHNTGLHKWYWTSSLYYVC